MHIDSSGLEVAEYRGGLALLGPSLATAVHELQDDPARPLHPPNPWHITLLTAAERRSLNASSPPRILPPAPSLSHIYALGIGSTKPGSSASVCWLTVVWNHADRYRASLGLPRKDYHITLTETDNHEVEKGIESLFRDASQETILERIGGMGEGALDHAFVACGDSVNIAALKRAIAERMVCDYPDSFKGFARLASIADPKLACLAYGRAATLNASLIPVAATQLQRLRNDASYGPVMTVEEQESINGSISVEHLMQPWSPALHRAVRVLWTHPTLSRDREMWGAHGLPRFFSWLYPGRVAGMSTPRGPADLEALVDMGFTHLLTLTEESPLPREWFARGAATLEHVFIPVPNYQPPTLAEMDIIFSRIAASGTWLVHCGGGVGRAGTVLACLVAMWGADGPQETQEVSTQTPRSLQEPVLDARTAISLLRHARPRSLETEAQEAFVSSWVSHRWKLAHGARPLSEPYTALTVAGTLGPPQGRPIVQTVFFVGRPGSGKSWLASALRKRWANTIVISQDESGRRTACEAEFGRAVKRDTLVVLDRCNPSAADRKRWLSLLGADHGPCVAVFFDYTMELCRQRIDARLNHPTLRAGRGGNALAQMDRELEVPSLSEGFSAVLTVTSFAAARDALHLLAPEPPLLKFPRTPHLFSLGAATDDDLIIATQHLSGPISVEEKIDGANMGISLDAGGTPRVQNRSHWVCAADHAQWRLLPQWLATHDQALRDILGRDSQCPERYILYGEWAVARHSVHYSALPGRFIAFDLYDRVQGTYLSHDTLAAVLSRTDPQIPQVPLLAQCNGITRDEIIPLLSRESAYGAHRLEGVYLRSEDAERGLTLGRHKVVRGDFIAGNEHWTRGPLEKNGYNFGE